MHALLARHKPVALTTSQRRIPLVSTQQCALGNTAQPVSPRPLVKAACVVCASGMNLFVWLLRLVCVGGAAREYYRGPFYDQKFGSYYMFNVCPSL